MGDQAGYEELTGSAGAGDGGAGEPQQGRGHGRRAVILGAAAAGAGAVAGMAVPAGAATASSDAPAAAVQLQSVVVAVHSTINPKQLLDLVFRVGGLVGCRTCGLVGIDLRLVGPDPVELKEAQSLAKLPGVGGVVISPL